ncbi:phosphoadenosine phosphosulfate reductase family protein [Propionivibrio sp.]|uniref:phosphoadenosine phosphosulfate reductase domain-containing protein n=1 Tax=Propionivibrio sp. TaxID=2212460 RepID=UPI003BF43FB6
MSEHNVLSFSGGKDSTAMLLLAYERMPDNLQVVMADTGNEHQITYDYVEYVSDWMVAKGLPPIRTVKADFARQIDGKREYVLTKWADKGVPQEAIDRAAAALVATGNPFLDLCVWKGRFPSSKVAFCSQELKQFPIINQVQKPLLDAGDDVISWQGVRRDESLRRSLLPMNELKQTFENGSELWNYRPIIEWTAADCFDMHKKHGIDPNPLYKMGMGRVGCMPCINCRKDELLEISKRFPEVIERIRNWEQAVKSASKRQGATFFAAPSDDSEWSATQTIDVFVEWSKTKRGGRLYDMFRMQNDGPVCSSIYGLCE